jgi:hypothetical protein
MKLKFQIGAWCFEVTGITARKVKKYGDEYTAIANIKIINDEVYIEGLLNKGPPLGKSDFKIFNKLLGILGLPKFVYVRYKKGVKNKRQRSIKK